MENILNELKNTQNSIEYIEDILYNDTIKNSILEEENIIIELKKNKNTNKQIIKEKKKLIITKFRDFIKEKMLKLYEENKKDNIEEEEEKEEKERKEIEKKLLLSYIKYYFKLISNYFKNYDEDNEFRKDILDQNNLGDILAEIQYYSANLLPEIIEDFSDDNKIFQKCIISLIQNLYGKLSEKSISKEFQKFDKKKLLKFERKINNTLSLFNKINALPLELKKMKEYIEAIKLKVKAKIFISSNNFISKFIHQKQIELNNLIEQYSNSIDYDVNILNELKGFQKVFGTKKMTKDEMFLKNFENCKKDIHDLFIVFNEYPVLDEEKKVPVYIEKELSNFIELNKQEKLNFLNDSKMRYDKFLNLIKENEENNILLQQVYEKIILLINAIKDEINNEKK